VGRVLLGASLLTFGSCFTLAMVCLSTFKHLSWSVHSW